MRSILAGVSLLLLILALACSSGDHSEKNSYWPLLAQLKQGRIIDLSHTFSEQTPRWEGFPALIRQENYHYEKDGFLTQTFTLVGQYSTHLDSPAHFHKGLRSLDQIPAAELALPAVVINVSAKVAANPDYQLSVDDVKDWERRNGPVPAGSFVINRSDWSKRWPDAQAFFNKDVQGQNHTPGWSLAALKFLFAERHITAIGHETADTDAGATNSLDNESYVLGLDHFQIELLDNVDQLPERGSFVIIGPAKPQGATGFPARVFAFAP